MLDYPSPMQHEATKATKTHEGSEWETDRDRFRTPVAKARAKALSGEIIGAAIQVHNQLGPGLLESVYRACLVDELRQRGIAHRRELVLPITYRGLVLEAGYRLDLLVEDLVILELKSVQRLEPIHRAQLLTYLRISGRWLGLLLNFNTDRLRSGLQRMLNG
jgi:GxxExxY protein